MSPTDLRALRRTVERDVGNYRYDAYPNMFGNPLTNEQIEGELAVMRTAILDPSWAEVELRDTLEQINAEQKAVWKCAVVADDGNGAFDPVENEFLLAVRRENELVSIGVRATRSAALWRAKSTRLKISVGGSASGHGYGP